MANSNTASSNKISLSADIVAAYVSRNSVTPVGLAALIESVHGALSKLGAVQAVLKLRLSCRQCRFGNPSHRAFLICLDDGKKLKTLKRHLTSLGMTPDQYRAKWGLPDSYPMVAPEYAATRWRLRRKVDSVKPRSGYRDGHPRRSWRRLPHKTAPRPTWQARSSSSQVVASSLLAPCLIAINK